MGTISDLQAALDRVENADDQLSELAALQALYVRIGQARSLAIEAALGIFTPTEIGRALNVSRQAMSKRRRAA